MNIRTNYIDNIYYYFIAGLDNEFKVRLVH